MIPTESEVRQMSDNLLNMILVELMEDHPAFRRYADRNRAKWVARLDELRDRMFDAMRRRWAMREE